MTAIYSITSGLHDEAAVKAISDEFLESIFGTTGDTVSSSFVWKGSDFSDYGTADFNVIYIRTGGAEGIFKELFHDLVDAGARYFTLLASGKSNSLAASLEILSWLRQQGFPGEVIHGSADYVRSRIEVLQKVAAARSSIYGTNIGVIGQPSDWLIASGYDSSAMLEKLGIGVQEIEMQRLLEAFDAQKSAMLQESVPAVTPPPVPEVRASLPDAIRIYLALKKIVEEDELSALTLRCFDLLGTVHNTGCYALARLNSEGIPSSCEGDVPALLSMIISRALTGRTGFQANPASIDVNSGEVLFAHCTISFDMVDRYCFDTHFESGIGVGIHGHVPEGPVTVFKISGSLDRAFIAEGELIRNQYEDNLCRTQVWIRLNPADARYFLTAPIGNHHIIIPGHCGELLREFVTVLQGVNL